MTVALVTIQCTNSPLRTWFLNKLAIRRRRRSRERRTVFASERNSQSRAVLVAHIKSGEEQQIMAGPSRRAILAAGAGVAASAGGSLADDMPTGVRAVPMLGPRNAERENQNPDIVNPPSTDRGGSPNLKYSFADAHVKARDGGWSREITARELPAARTIAGVNMRLAAGGVRELHWHKEAEWAFMLAGSARITALDSEGREFVADVRNGDLWYFPEGIPHSIQGLGDEGCEFLLAFSDGHFSEDSTFPITDMFAHMPREVLAKNFRVDRSAFRNIPAAERFIFRAPQPHEPVPDGGGERRRSGADLDMTFRMMEAKPDFESDAGWARIVDTKKFPISVHIAAALVEVNPGHLREIHWHPNADEWQYYIAGKGRMTVFSAEGRARTFDYQAGDVGAVPISMPHYIENTGDTPLRFLELFRTPIFEDISLMQWMAKTPHELVVAHLNLDRELVDGLPVDKYPII